MRFIKKLIHILVSIYMLLILTGCGQQKGAVKDTPIVSVILIGNHANSQNFDIQLEVTIKKTYSSFGNIGIIVVDGTPTLLYDENSTDIVGCYSEEYLQKSKEDCNDNSIYWANQYLTPQTIKISTILDTCKADDPEVDTLGALHTAVESLNAIEGSMGTAVEKEIIILDTGLCTSGALNFLTPKWQELLNLETKIWEDGSASTDLTNLIKQLKDKAELPDLENIRITWYGLGQVSAPQESLSNLNIQNLQYIWGELLKETNCLPSTEVNADKKYGIFVPTSAHGSIECEQYVTPVQWELPEESAPPEYPELPEQKIVFCPNSDEYLYPDKTEEILKPYISVLKGSTDKMILLVGTTSSWKGGSQRLSEERAKKVKDSMITLGIPEACITTIGLGYDLNICQDDSPEGEFEESIAQENRSVLILPYDSPKAQEILFGNN